MKSRQEYAKQLWRLVLNYQRQNLGMPTDVDVDRARAEFLATIGSTAGPTSHALPPILKSTASCGIRQPRGMSR